MVHDLPLAGRGRADWLLGRAVLVVSGFGYPLTQVTISRFGRGGAVFVEGIAAGLLVRDAAMVRLGTPRRLKAFPAALLWAELAGAGVAAVGGIAAIARPNQPVDRTPAGLLEGLRRFSVGFLFGMHTYRFWIYLQPGHGLREPTGRPAQP